MTEMTNAGRILSLDIERKRIIVYTVFKRHLSPSVEEEGSGSQLPTEAQKDLTFQFLETPPQLQGKWDAKKCRTSARERDTSRNKKAKKLTFIPAEERG